MKKLIALIGAVALGGAVQAATWFDAGVDELGAGATLDTTYWSTENATVNDGSITLESGSAIYTPTDSKALADKPTVSARVTFTAYDSDALPAVESDMKGGLILVVDDNDDYYFYGLASDGDADSPANVWTKLNISGAENTATDVAMTLDTDGYIAYTIGDKTTDYYTIVLPTDAIVSKACVNGTGVLSSLKGTYVDLITIAVPVLPEGVSAVSIVDGNGESVTIDEGKISVAPGTKLVITYTAADGYILSNGVITIDSVSTDTTIDTSSVTSEKAAAKIGTTLYLTLKEAVGAADAGATVTLLANAAIDSTITVNKNLTINLDGFDITATDCRAILVSAGKLTLDGEGTITSKKVGDVADTDFTSDWSVIKVGSNTAETELLVGADVTITSDWAYTLTYFGTQPQTVTVNGTVSYTGTEQTAMSGNGKSTYAASTVNVNGTVTSTYTTAIYKPEAGTLTVNGKVEGFGGIEVKAGDVVIASTGSVTATAPTQSQESNTNGTSTTGYAIAAVNNSSYNGSVNVTINGGVTGAVAYVEDAKVATENVPVVTVAEGATITTVDGQKVKDGQLVYITYATVTIETVENCTISVTENTFPIISGAKYDVDAGIELVVTRTPAEGYALTSAYAATETIKVTDDVTITAEVEEYTLADATYSYGFNGDTSTASSILGGDAWSAAPSDRGSDDSYVTVRGASSVNAVEIMASSWNPYFDAKLHANVNEATATWSLFVSARIASTENGVIWALGRKTEGGLALYQSGSNIVLGTFNKSDDSDGAPTALISKATTKVFHNYTVVSTGSKLQLWIDTEMAGEVDAVSLSTSGWQFGGIHGGMTDGLVKGEGTQLDEFGFWTTALTAVDMADLATKFPAWPNREPAEVTYTGSMTQGELNGETVDLIDGDTLVFTETPSKALYQAEEWSKYKVNEGVTVTFGHDGNNSQGHKNLADGTVIENSGNVVFGFWGNGSQQGYAEIGTVTINGGTFDVDMVNAKYLKVGTAINGTATLASDSTAIIELDTLTSGIDLGRYTAAKSTLKIGADFTGYWAKYCSIAGDLDLNGHTVTFSNGYASDAYTINRLVGEGTINITWSSIQPITITNVLDDEGNIAFTGTITGYNSKVTLPEGYELDSNGYIVKSAAADITSAEIGVTIPSDWATANGVTADNVDTAITGNAQKMTYAEAYALGYNGEEQLTNAVFKIVELTQAADGTWSIKTDPELREDLTGVEIVTEKSTDLKTWSTTADGNFFRAKLQKATQNNVGEE